MARSKRFVNSSKPSSQVLDEISRVAFGTEVDTRICGHVRSTILVVETPVSTALVHHVLLTFMSSLDRRWSDVARIGTTKEVFVA